MRSRIAAIVLAAGRSSRMGLRNKLLEPIDGKPIIAHVADAALESGADPVVVVTGFDAPRIEAALRQLKATYAHNAEFESGLSSSIRTGLGALPADIDGALMLLGDMPAVDAAVLSALMAAFTGRDGICVPAHRGRRGNPVLWGRGYFLEMMALTGDAGAKALLARHAGHVTEVAVKSDSIFADVDTPADLAQLTAGAKERRSR